LLNKVLKFIDEKWEEYFEEVLNFLRMPSISATGEGIEETAKFLRDFLIERFNAEVKLLRYGGHPIVYGYVDSRADKTLILYNMYDVQPVEPLEKWIAPPFKAKIIEGKVIARGAVNTKAPLMSMLLGLEALQRTTGKIPVNLYFILEGEEELGSPSMPKLIEDKREELSKSQATFFMLPTERPKGKPKVILGNKGIIYLEVKVKTSEYDVHSSLIQMHYNPIEILANFISTLKDKNGNILAEWLYEDIITPTEEDLKYLPELMEAVDINEIAQMHGIRKLRGAGKDLYIEVYFKPSINIDGILGGHTGPGTKTITPAEASAKIDIRLVPNMDPKKILEKFMKHIEETGFENWIEVKVHDMYDWSRTSPESHIAKAARKAYLDLNMKPYTITTITGSAPAYLFTKKLKVPVAMAGPGYGGRAHAPNEFIEVEGIKKMIEYMPALIINWAKEEFK